MATLAAQRLSIWESAGSDPDTYWSMVYGRTDVAPGFDLAMLTWEGTREVFAVLTGLREAIAAKASIKDLTLQLQEGLDGVSSEHPEVFSPETLTHLQRLLSQFLTKVWGVRQGPARAAAVIAALQS